MILVAGLLGVGAAQSEAAPAIQQVLMLQSHDRGTRTYDYFTGVFREELDERAGGPVNIVQVAIGSSDSTAESEQALLDYIHAAFANRSRPDLIVTVAGSATAFARRHRERLFPETPILYASVDQRFLRGAPLGDNETAVAVVNDYPHLVDEILQVLPRTRQVFVVIGAGTLSQFWRQELEEPFRRFADRVTFVWSGDLSVPEMLRRCANLPPDSAIMYFTFGTDAQGGEYSEERVLGQLHASANAPLFSGQSPLFGAGIVGGSLMSLDEIGRHAADVAARLLKGAPPRTIRLAPLVAGAPVFDWRELERWGIPESRLPHGSDVRYRRPSVWVAYRFAILSAAGVLLVQSLLIVGLLYQRRARVRAEIDSRKHLALAADASRRETVSALAGTIGHELSQPLGAMLHNTRALRMLVAAQPATTAAISEIVEDIENQGLRATEIVDRVRGMLRGRELRTQPIDMHTVIADTVALLAHDMRTRRIEAALDLSPRPCTVDGDPILLQQVLVNLVMNAMDAMTDTPVPMRRLTIGSEVRHDSVAVSISDTGVGLSPQLGRAFFSPFATTKPHGIGIGLTIVRSIVDAHGGTIEGQNNPRGGATFTVTLPRGTSQA